MSDDGSWTPSLCTFLYLISSALDNIIAPNVFHLHVLEDAELE